MKILYIIKMTFNILHSERYLKRVPSTEQMLTIGKIQKHVPNLRFYINSLCTHK